MGEKATTGAAEVIRFRQDIQDLLQRRVIEAVEVVLREELAIALGSLRYERTEERLGYRNGSEVRQITTHAGTRQIEVPRGRLFNEDKTTREFQSEVLPRYARRAKAVDAAVLSSYLAGANSRRIAAALKPLLGSMHLSKSAVSRVVGRLKQSFAEWSARDLSAESYPVLFLDGFHLKVRIARRVVSVPAMAVMGVTLNGEKVLLSLRLAASEAATHWSGTILELQKRGLGAPELIVVDGHQGLGKSLAAWPKAEIQRCVVHKLRNLEEHCPPHARREMKRDYDRIVYADDGMKAREAYQKFGTKWRRLAPAVASSLEEAGDELLTFYRWPKQMWKSLRTTNPLENLNREFRRRTKTQGSFSTEDGALILLYGLVAMGHIKLRKIDGHQQLAAFVGNADRSAA